MIDHGEPSYKQIRNLLTVLALGVVCAAILSGFFLYYYGPTGIYKLKNVMLDPSLVNELSYAAQSQKTGKTVRFNFEKTEFSYWQTTERQWSKTLVSAHRYRQFYDKFADEKSIEEVSSDILNQFLRLPPAKLTLTVRQSNDDSSSPSKVFQEVHFANEGDFYRVELNEQSANTGWAYFYHPHVYQDVMALFLDQKGAL